jgi:hypothetical protein
MASPPARSDVDPTSPAWQKYYADASRRRRELRKLHPRTLTEDRRHRRRIENLLLVGSILFICGLTAFFHAVLTR